VVPVWVADGGTGSGNPGGPQPDRMTCIDRVGQVRFGSPPWPVPRVRDGQAGVPGWPTWGSTRCEGSNVFGGPGHGRENGGIDERLHELAGQQVGQVGLKKGSEADRSLTTLRRPAT